ncbi:MAG: HAD family hydrolase [Chloroflexota bacterium]
MTTFTKTIKIIAFDADDTLWVNETHFNDVQAQFSELFSRYASEEAIGAQLYEVEKENLRLFGYGAKGFILSLIETAVQLTNGSISGHDVQKIIDLGKELLARPVQLVDGVPHVLDSLDEDYALMVLTKGDLFDQESKLARSGLAKYFHHVEIVSEKRPDTYRDILNRYGVEPHEFVMIGNSLRSDILPVLEIGAYAIHVPFHSTWVHEQVPADALADKQFLTLSSVQQVLEHFETPMRHS